MDQDDHNSPLDTTDKEADDRLVHALLLHLHDRQAGQRRERRVSGVMEAIGRVAEEKESGGPVSPAATRSRPLSLSPWARRGAWVAAAAILLAVGTYIVISGQTPAMASLNDVLSALSLPGDRAFRIRVKETPAEVVRGPAGDQPLEEQHRPGLDQAMLYLRDGRQYLLVRQDPKGGELFDGYDGRESWRVRAGVLVETREGPGAGGIPMPQIMADVPFADLQSTLLRIRTDYTVDRFDSAPVPSGGEPMRHVLARRHSPEVKGPDTIEIWADPRTGMPRRIVFERAKFQGSPHPRRLTFDLVSQDPLSADWFNHTSHTAVEKR